MGFPFSDASSDYATQSRSIYLYSILILLSSPQPLFDSLAVLQGLSWYLSVYVCVFQLCLCLYVYVYVCWSMSMSVYVYVYMCMSMSSVYVYVYVYIYI